MDRSIPPPPGGKTNDERLREYRFNRLLFLWFGKKPRLVIYK